MPDCILYDISSFPTRVHSRTCCVFRFAIHTFGLYILNACDGIMVWFCPRWFVVDLILPFSDNLSHLSVAARSGRRRARVVQVYSNSWWHFSTARRKTGRIRGNGRRRKLKAENVGPEKPKKGPKLAAHSRPNEINRGTTRCRAAKSNYPRGNQTFATNSMKFLTFPDFLCFSMHFSSTLIFS